MKKCNSCNIIKSTQSFNKSKQNSDGLNKHCRICCAEDNKKYRTSKTNTIEGYIKLSINKWRYAAKSRNFKFSNEITPNFVFKLFLDQKGKCALSGIPLTWITQKGVVNTNLSLDRINSNVGYFPDNVQLTCCIINRMKLDNTEIEFKNWCRSVAEKA